MMVEGLGIVVSAVSDVHAQTGSFGSWFLGFLGPVL